MKTRDLGKTGIGVSAIGLGGMPMSLDGRPSEEESIRVIHRALDLGVTLIDTADSYCIDESDKHHNERLIARALSSYSKTTRVIVATKGGLVRPQGRWEVNGDPKHLKKTIRESYAALGGSSPIPLWQLHAVDDHFPIEDSLKPVRDAVDEGLIRFVGLSNVDVDEVRRARQIVEIVSVQNRYNPWDRSPEKDGVLEYCEKEGLTFFPWSPLGGSYRVKSLREFPQIAALAKEKGITPQRLVLAWLLAKSPCLVPIPGASHLPNLEDSVPAADVPLSPAEVEKMDQ